MPLKVILISCSIIHSINYMLRVNSLKKQAKSQNSSELLITGIKRVCKMGKGQMVNVLQENIYS